MHDAACWSHGGAALVGVVQGGGLFINGGQVTIDACEIYDCKAYSGEGGGLAVAGGLVSLRECNISCSENFGRAAEQARNRIEGAGNGETDLLVA